MTKIIYFSGTGNSLNAAKKISNELGAELISLNKAPLTLSDDKIGFVFPVYCGDLPFNFKNYLDKVNLDSDYIFSVSVSGGGPLKANYSVHSILNKKGLKLSYFADLTTADNSIVYGATDFNDTNQKADNALINIIEDLKKEVTREKIKNKGYLNPYVKIMWKGFRSFYRLDRKAVETEKCSKCTQCVKICPTQNVIFKDGTISFKNNCVYCFACIHWCPTHAITFGKLKVNDKTAYHHPKINANEIIEGNKIQ